MDLSQGVIKVSKTVYCEKDKQGISRLYIDTPKTDASNRVIPFPKYITNFLQQGRIMAATPYVVENKKGQRMSVRSYQYLFKKLTERAGVRRLNFHALRHTFATRAIECGIDIRTVADIMGHRNASMTLNRYAHCMMDHKMKMMQKLPKVL